MLGLALLHVDSLLTNSVVVVTLAAAALLATSFIDSRALLIIAWVAGQSPDTLNDVRVVVVNVKSVGISLGIAVGSVDGTIDGI